RRPGRSDALRGAPAAVVNGTASAYLRPLSLHDALPISSGTKQRMQQAPAIGGQPASRRSGRTLCRVPLFTPQRRWTRTAITRFRSEEHTSELQSRENLVCRLLLEKKKYDRDRTRTRPGC